MKVNRAGDSTLDINLTNDEAGLLLNVLHLVSDCTDSEALDGLYNRLMDLNVTPEGVVTIEENPLFDEDETDDEYNIVVED